MDIYGPCFIELNIFNFMKKWTFLWSKKFLGGNHPFAPSDYATGKQQYKISDI